MEAVMRQAVFCQREGRRGAMRMLKRGALAASLCVAGLVLASAARADVSSTHPAGLIIFPKVVVFNEGPDTEIQISNTSGDPVHVRCYLVNATPHCSNEPTRACQTSEGCGGGICLPGWTETDFRFTLTKFQPIVWRLSQGLASFPIDGINHTTQDGQFNSDSNIPPAPEIPFVGELKCFQVDEAENPVARNDLKGEATMVTVDGRELDARQYNAVGIQATDVNDGNDTLCLGGTEPTEECPEPEYNGCPNVLILDHLFDDLDPPFGERVLTVLNLVPCSEDFLNQSTAKTTLQFLVFNEFEQRFSTSRRVNCLFETTLSDIDTRFGQDDDSFSIWNVAIEGTLSGQTRIRPVQTDETNVGHGFVGFAEEYHNDGQTYSAAFQLHFAGLRSQGDIIRAPRE
jgi:hypothetical protein